MEMTGFEIAQGLTPNKKEVLLSCFKGVIHTQCNFITIENVKIVNSIATRYTIKCLVSGVRYLVEDIFTLSGKHIYLNLGLVV